MMNAIHVTVCSVLVIGCLTTAIEVRADAQIVTKAMEASTIAELFVDKDSLRADIEIGSNDVPAFMNIYPDDLYEKLGGKVKPLEERHTTFFNSDWIVQADGQTLPGTLTQIAVDKRVLRDEVTGEPLAEQPTDSELVVRLSLKYPLTGRPKTLTLRPPLSDGIAAATIGFVCYHNGLPVNDFRYLSDEVTLDLDWDDPWYSRFRHRNLRRQFDAPLSVFLYVEPYEVRKEVIVRPKDLEPWLDFDLDDSGTIPVDKQQDLKHRVAEYLAERSPVVVDGRAMQGRLDRIHFIHRSLRTTGIIEPPVELDATSATLGVIFVYPIDSLPTNVTMRWELFTTRIRSVPAVVSDEAGGLPVELTPEDSLLEWHNYLTNPTSPQLRTIELEPLRQTMQIPLLSLLCGCIALASAGVFLTKKSTSGRPPKAAFITLTLAIFGGALSLPTARVSVPIPFSSASPLTEAEGHELLGNLLYNVYRSFDHHDDSLIYDRLSQSISGDLLEEVYLETRQSMEVKNQGGLRVSVKELEVTDLNMISKSTAGSTFECRWRVVGWIGHWGHVHERENEHFARITVAARNQSWKITAMEMLDEQSLEPGSRTVSKAGDSA